MSITPKRDETNDTVLEVLKKTIDQVERIYMKTGNGHCGESPSNENILSNSTDQLNCVDAVQDQIGKDIHLECLRVSLTNGNNCNELTQSRSNVIGAAAMVGRGYCMVPILKMINCK